ncbi:uncharacterized protein LOC125943517 [Dermacentor silvarum]|uniref:uncharacterized protein LOC125943517 n=1 Tax=Dermacentor silvarum TaxID=543639 RepID=UPI002100FA61|nr:uncharacterized protein LOC125943517 [Dermacentor silvarum]
MLVLPLFVLFLPQVLSEYVKRGECPGPGQNPNKTVESCNYYCKGNNTKWVNTFFVEGTVCEYSGGTGYCLVDDIGTSCYPRTHGRVERWKAETSGSSTKSPTRKTKKKKDKKKKPENKNNTKSTTTRRASKRPPRRKTPRKKLRVGSASTAPRC